jgi:hypothetical protein
MWISIGSFADPDPAFNLNEDPEPDPESQTNADLCGSAPDHILRHKKLHL